MTTSTTTDGEKFPFLETILKNFSAPKSAPNPASITTKSASLRAMLVAIIEFVPIDIFAKGPP